MPVIAYTKVIRKGEFCSPREVENVPNGHSYFVHEEDLDANGDGVSLSTLAFADNIKTQEQSIHETMASLAGGAIRVMKGDKSECGAQYQGGEKEACEKGFNAQDKTLNKPASN